MNRIYSATYSNVPVYEFNVAGNHVMRRRADHWINATHILKVADYDKPARTRILEREVQKGVHEKVQGGYGKYQGTWIPLHDGKLLAQRNGCLDKLSPIFDFVPGDRSPPPAPKHATASSARPKAPRAPAQPRKQPGKTLKAAPVFSGRADYAPVSARNHRMSEVSFDTYSAQPNDDDSIEQATIDSVMSDEDMMDTSRYTGGSRKRKRGMEPPPQPAMSRDDQQHLMWSDELLDFFMLQRSDDPPPPAPEPPAGIDLNRAVDEKGNTALHWAAAMGDLNLVQDFIRRGAKIDSLTHSGSTPLMHAVTFTNNYDKNSMVRLVESLYETSGQRDCNHSTVFHHIAASTMSKSKYPVARYYLECLLGRLKQAYEGRQVAMLLDMPDRQGNTAALLAAKYGARKCARILTSYGTSVDIPNHEGETAEKYIQELNERRRTRHANSNFRGSSSPMLPPHPPGGNHDSSQSQQDPQLTASQQQQPTSSQQHRAQQYASEAASLLSTQLPTLIQSRTEALAAALDTELAEREAEAREGERLLEQRQNELAVLRKQNVSLSAQEEDSTHDEQQAAEVELLEAQSRQSILAEQSGEFARHLSRVREQERSTRGVNGDVDGDFTYKLDLARRLQAAQATRNRLVDEMIAAQGLAGVGGERQEAYKRLITSALGVRTEDIEGMLPEIVEELEEARASGLGLGATIGNGVVSASAAAAAADRQRDLEDSGYGDGTLASVRTAVSGSNVRGQKAASKSNGNGVLYQGAAAAVSGPVRVMG